MMHDREGMLKGAADILGERLAKATMRVAELEAIVLQMPQAAAQMAALKARVAELEGQLRDMRILGGKTLAERNDALGRVAELEAQLAVAHKLHGYARVAELEGQLELTAFVLEDAAEVIKQTIYKNVSEVWMKRVKRARAALAKGREG